MIYLGLKVFPSHPFYWNNNRNDDNGNRRNCNERGERKSRQGGDIEVSSYDSCS